MYTDEPLETTREQQYVGGLPVDMQVLFSDREGAYDKQIESRKTGLLQNMAFLGKFLDPDERIVFVTTGRSPFSGLDYLTAGFAWLDAAKRAVFVFTNKRLFHIPTTSQFQYRGSIAQIPYHGCKDIRTGRSSLTVEYRNGRKDRFTMVPRADCAKIDRVVADHCSLGATCDADADSLPAGRTHLCPSCTHVLTYGVTTCPSCGLEFKTMTQARLHALVVPGGGYFYTNQFFMGVVDAFVETWVMAAILLWAGAAYLGNKEAWYPSGIALTILLFGRLMTIYHANAFVAEFIPRNLKQLLAQPHVPVRPPDEPPAPQREQTREEALSVR